MNKYKVRIEREIPHDFIEDADIIVEAENEEKAKYRAIEAARRDKSIDWCYVDEKCDDNSAILDVLEITQLPENPDQKRLF